VPNQKASISASTKPAIESLSIVGHYECNYLDQTVPVLSELLALEVVETGDKQATMKHQHRLAAGRP
jgi:hypothetical protein